MWCVVICKVDCVCVVICKVDCVCVVICKVDCVCVVICKVDCVVCSDLQEKSSKRSKLQFFLKNINKNCPRRRRVQADAVAAWWPLCTARCWGAVDRGADAAAAPSRAARDGATSAPKQTGGRGAGAAAKTSASLQLLLLVSSRLVAVAVAHARDPRRSAKTRGLGFEPAA